ncbi:MAG: putative salt-induced outer membrane protein YdiY [Pseudomonadales bacterium]|jgi:putative salt-induced outer membrane protein YdiY
MFKLRHLKVISYALFSISLAIFSNASLANVVTLKNGSILIGGSVSKQEDQLIMSTSFAGEIRINWDEIAEIKVHQPIEVHTIDGEIIETLLIVNDNSLPTDGPLITLEDGSHTGSDSPYVDSDDVAIINPEPWELGIGSKFNGLVDFGLQYNSGNTETESLTASTDLNWERVDDRWGVQARYFNEKTNSVTTQDNWLIRSNYDHFLTDSWYTGIYGQLEQNQIANLDQRLSVGPSLGRQFWQSDETNLSSEVGLVYVDEKFDYDASDAPEDRREDNTYTGFRWNIKYDRYTFKDIIQIYYENELLLDAKDISNDERTVFKAVIGARVFLIENLSAGAEFQYDYDGSAIGTTKKEDTRTVIKLGYSW